MELELYLNLRVTLGISLKHYSKRYSSLYLPILLTNTSYTWQYLEGLGFHVLERIRLLDGDWYSNDKPISPQVRGKSRPYIGEGG